MCSESAASRFKQLRPSYGFDEVAIVPGDFTINPDQTSTEFHIGDFTFEIPILASAMDAVIDVKFAILHEPARRPGGPQPGRRPGPL